MLCISIFNGELKTCLDWKNVLISAFAVKVIRHCLLVEAIVLDVQILVHKKFKPKTKILDTIKIREVVKKILIFSFPMLLLFLFSSIFLTRQYSPIIVTIMNYFWRHQLFALSKTTHFHLAIAIGFGGKNITLYENYPSKTDMLVCSRLIDCNILFTV